MTDRWEFNLLNECMLEMAKARGIAPDAVTLYRDPLPSETSKGFVRIAFRDSEEELRHSRSMQEGLEVFWIELGQESYRLGAAEAMV